MKKLTKTASKRLNLTSEKVRSLNDAKQLTTNELGGVAGGQRGTIFCGYTMDGCHCDCSSYNCIG